MPAPPMELSIFAPKDDGTHATYSLRAPFSISGTTDAMLSLARQITDFVDEAGGHAWLPIQGDEEEMARLQAEKAIRDEDRILAEAEKIRERRLENALK